jgi:hypothetical protein
VEEGMKVKHELVMSLSNVSVIATTTTTEGSKAQVTKKDVGAGERAIKDDPVINPSPRCSPRISQRKLREGRDQQVKVKVEPMEEHTEPEPHTPKKKEIFTALKGSEGKEGVQIKQEDDEQSLRRSTRIASKRKFADEPWDMAIKKSKQ